MKTFIFILYIMFILIIPQLYTWLIRKAYDEPEVQTFFIIFGALILGIITFGFTMLLIQWNVISITL